MPRSPFQVLVIPFQHNPNSQFRYGVLRRSDDSKWQFISGGGEDSETPIATAVREAREEAMVPADADWIILDSIAAIPRSEFPGSSHWPCQLTSVPEHCFAVNMTKRDIILSAEHDSFEWLDYQQAIGRLTWQSNQNALCELNQRLGHPCSSKLTEQTPT